MKNHSKQVQHMADTILLRKVRLRLQPNFSNQITVYTRGSRITPATPENVTAVIFEMRFLKSPAKKSVAFSPWNTSQSVWFNIADKSLSKLCFTWKGCTSSFCNKSNSSISENLTNIIVAVKLKQALTLRVQFCYAMSFDGWLQNMILTRFILRFEVDQKQLRVVMR